MEIVYNSNLPDFHMVVGLPGSGKSTYIEQHFNKNIKIHSSDVIREELSGDVGNQNINELVFKTLHNRVKEDLKNGISCVYDATNISWKRRKAFLNELKSIRCWKVCHFIATPFEVCVEQNKQRDRIVPYQVIEKMYKNFDVPWYNEGWDDINVWYEKKEYLSAYGTWSDFIYDTMNCDQESKYHSATLGEHCKNCLDYVKVNEDKLSALIWNELRIAAALHDCGKPFTKSFIDSRGNKSDTAHYYNHEKIGSYNSFFYSDAQDEYYDKLTVAALIRWHMIMHFYKDWEQKTIGKYEKEFTKNKYLQEMNFYKALSILYEGDKNAH